VNIKLTIAYDGSRYLGWQKTEMGPSIEEELQRALSQILQEDVALQAASRTDAGVHAAGQVVNLIVPHESACLQKLKIGLNGLLPKDIVVMEAEEVLENFHPTLDCKAKEYHYSLCYASAPIPLYRHCIWHYPYALDIAAIRQAAKLLTGEYDFRAFCNSRKEIVYSDYVRRVESITIVELEDKCLRFEIRGNNFLYKMVRNLVGTLVYAGCGKIDVEAIPAILEAKDRTQAGVTAPAHGLSLHRVYY
jgi:tRNA pseudouridine38-40 synthase